VDEIVKQCGPKVAYSNDFLGSGHPGKVATECTTMAVIQDSIGFVDSQTSMKDGVDSSTI
jgi:hypothetical protein